MAGPMTRDDKTNNDIMTRMGSNLGNGALNQSFREEDEYD
jgi:hypothetical protein